MKKKLLKPAVIVPVIIGVCLSFCIFLKISEKIKLDSYIADAVKIKSLTAPLPVSNLTDSENKINQYENLTKGKVLLVYITTACFACKREIEIVSQILPKLNSEMQVYAVSLEGQNKLNKFVQENDLKFPVLTDNGAKILTDLDIKYFPTKLLIENGIITKEWSGSSADEMSLLKELNLGEGQQ